MKNTDKQKDKQNSVKLLNGTSFSQYAIDNIPPSQNKNFIEKKSQYARFSFAFQYKSQIFGVWVDYNQGKIFVSNDYDKNTHYMFACTLQDHTPNTMLLSSISNYHCWKVFTKNFKLR